jgi:dihydroorotase
MPCSLCWFVGKSGVVFAVKLYPAGATTNSQDGVTDILGKCLPVLEEMVRQEMPLLVSSSCSSSYMHLKVSVHLPG